MSTTHRVAPGTQVNLDGTVHAEGEKLDLGARPDLAEQWTLAGYVEPLAGAKRATTVAAATGEPHRGKREVDHPDTTAIQEWAQR